MTEIETTEANDDQLPEAPPQVTDFGAPLKRAREEAGYSLAEVSDQLKLSADLLQALESSQLEELPAATFTQGYLRNYARLLKLPADEIVQAYNRQVPTVEPDLTSTSGLPAQKNSHDVVVKIISYGLLVIGLLLLALWFQQTDLGWISEPEPEPVYEPMESTGVESEALREAMGGSTEQTDVQPEQVPEGDSVEQVPADSAIQQPVNIMPEPEPEPEPEAKSRPVSSPPQSDSKPAADTAKTEKVVTIAAGGNDELVISTQSESWTEIQGADGGRLLFKLLQQGQNYRIKGRAPFRVFLGNAPSVAMSMNGESIDISSYIRSNNIANFVINEDASISSGREFPSPDTTATPTQATEPAADDSSRGLMFDEGR